MASNEGSEEIVETCREHLQQFGQPDWVAEDDFERALHTFGLNPTPDDIRMFCNKYVIHPKGQTSRMSVKNFAEAALELMNRDPAEELRDAFHILDKDNKGYLTPVEFKNAMKSLCDVPEEDLDEVVMLADKDSDGRIDIDEFVEALMN